MSKLKKLQDAGVIDASATFDAADQAVINSLTDNEITALISIYDKLPPEFMAKHAKQSTAKTKPAARTIGIVF